MNHSQSISDAPLKGWVLIKPSGTILTAHCECKAGRGETCSHVGACLFALEYAETCKTRTCTSQSNKWLPPNLREVPCKEVRSYDFTSAETKRRRVFEDDPQKPQTVASLQLPEIETHPPHGLTPVPSSVLLDMFKNLEKENQDCAVFRVVPELCAKYAPKETKLPEPFTSLFSKECVGDSLESIRKKCEEIFQDLSITDSDIENIEFATRKQGDCDVWNKQREGKITASIMYRMLTADPNNPSISLLKEICYSSDKDISHIPAVAHGKKKNEKKALYAYAKQVAKMHTNFSMRRPGLYLLREHFFIGASPDALVTCTCHGEYAVEVKCPTSENVD